jgi:hypothetical protein
MAIWFGPSELNRQLSARVRALALEAGLFEQLA